MLVELSVMEQRYQAMVRRALGTVLGRPGDPGPRRSEPEGLDVTVPGSEVGHAVQLPTVLRSVQTGPSQAAHTPNVRCSLPLPIAA